jgi:hypothetical protein
MTDPETRLAALWAQDEPPAQDPIFVGVVATRIEQRRWLQTALELSVLGLAALAVGWAVWPFVAADLMRAAPWLTVAAAVGLAIWSVDRTLSGYVFGGYEDFTREFASE